MVAVAELRACRVRHQQRDRTRCFQTAWLSAWSMSVRRRYSSANPVPSATVAVQHDPVFGGRYAIETRSLPARSLLPSSLYLDHSHAPCVCQLPLAALPSTRAIETRLLPSSLTATHRGFAFYVAFPKRSIPSLATCSMSLIPSAPFPLTGTSLPAP